MNKRIYPLSEAFLYCSPESMERRLYRVPAAATRSKRPRNKPLPKKGEQHVPNKVE